MSEQIAQLRQAAIQAHQAGKHDTALVLYGRYLNARPDDGGMWSNLGVLHRVMGQSQQALRAHRRAHVLDPKGSGTRNNLANVLSDIGRYDESIALREGLLAETPDDLNHLAMVGRCLRGKGDYSAAITHLQRCVAQYPTDPELRLQLAFAYLAKGDYAQGFDIYRARWDAAEMTPRNLGFPQWQGETLAGKTVLVLPEQGFGDAIMFMRFLPALKALGCKVLFVTEKPVARIFESLPGADWTGNVVPKSTAVDYWVNMMDLALLYFGSQEAIPKPTKLTIPGDSIARAKAIVAPFQKAFKIGVVWTGSHTYKGNAFRSFSHTDFLPLTEIPGVQLFSLYKGPSVAAYEADGSSAFIVDAGSSERDFADCAASMQQMDLVISSDTATTHVAGSVGVPTWTILHWDAFWIWGHTGEKSPWYPNMRLFRQQTPLEWTPVMKDVETALRKEMKARL